MKRVVIAPGDRKHVVTSAPWMHPQLQVVVQQLRRDQRHGLIEMSADEARQLAQHLIDCATDLDRHAFDECLQGFDVDDYIALAVAVESAPEARAEVQP